MRKQDRAKITIELEKELKEYRKLSRVQRDGRKWIREVRQALGMSVTELAHRLKCARSLVYRMEEAEARGDDRLKLMQRVASAMDCRLVYAIVPMKGRTLEQTAAWLKKTPRWETPKQEARSEKAREEYSRKLNEEHWESVRKQRIERARAKTMEKLAEKMADDYAIEQAKRAADEAAGRPPEEGWTAKWAWEWMQAERRKSGKGVAESRCP